MIGTLIRLLWPPYTIQGQTTRKKFYLHHPHQSPIMLLFINRFGHQHYIYYIVYRQ